MLFFLLVFTCVVSSFTVQCICRTEIQTHAHKQKFRTPNSLTNNSISWWMYYDRYAIQNDTLTSLLVFLFVCLLILLLLLFGAWTGQNTTASNYTEALTQTERIPNIPSANLYNMRNNKRFRIDLNKLLITQFINKLMYMAYAQFNYSLNLAKNNLKIVFDFEAIANRNDLFD